MLEKIKNNKGSCPPIIPILLAGIIVCILIVFLPSDSAKKTADKMMENNLNTLESLSNFQKLADGNILEIETDKSSFIVRLENGSFWNQKITSKTDSLILLNEYCIPKNTDIAKIFEISLGPDYSFFEESNEEIAQKLKDSGSYNLRAKIKSMTLEVTLNLYDSGDFYKLKSIEKLTY